MEIINGYANGAKTLCTILRIKLECLTEDLSTDSLCDGLLEIENEIQEQIDSD
jgi:hypothetical protein